MEDSRPADSTPDADAAADVETPSMPTPVDAQAAAAPLPAPTSESVVSSPEEPAAPPAPAPISEPLAVAPVEPAADPGVAPEEAEDAAVSQSPDFEALLKESESSSQTSVSVGQMIEGTIQGFGDSTAFVDFGGRSEAVIDLQELKDENEELAFKAGDSIKAYVTEVEGEVKLSRALKVSNRQGLRNAYEHRMPVEGRVTGFNTGGLVVNVGGLRAFCPFSLVDTAYTGDPADYAGQTLTFRILEFKGGGRNIVLSRRAHMEGEAAEKAEELRANLEVGATLDGTVSRIERFGAFVDVGGVEGLVHVSEMNHTRVEDPGSVVTVGDTIQVKVLELKDLGKRNERISLSMKALLPDPWEEIASRFREGDVITGKVVSVQKFGAFVELMPGIEGLVHISQLSQKRVANPGEVVTEGQEVQARVLQIEARRKRVSLSMKALEEHEQRQAASEDMEAFRTSQAPPQAEDGPMAEALRRAGLL